MLCIITLFSIVSFLLCLYCIFFCCVYFFILSGYPGLSSKLVLRLVRRNQPGSISRNPAFQNPLQRIIRRFSTVNLVAFGVDDLFHSLDRIHTYPSALPGGTQADWPLTSWTPLRFLSAWNLHRGGQQRSEDNVGNLVSVSSEGLFHHLMNVTGGHRSSRSPYRK